MLVFILICLSVLYLLFSSAIFIYTYENLKRRTNTFIVNFGIALFIGIFWVIIVIFSIISSKNNEKILE